MGVGCQSLLKHYIIILFDIYTDLAVKIATCLFIRTKIFWTGCTVVGIYAQTCKMGVVFNSIGRESCEIKGI